MAYIVIAQSQTHKSLSIHVFNILFENPLRGEDMICLEYLQKPGWGKLGDMAYILVLILPHLKLLYEKKCECW